MSDKSLRSRFVGLFLVTIALISSFSCASAGEGPVGGNINSPTALSRPGFDISGVAQKVSFVADTDVVDYPSHDDGSHTPAPSGNAPLLENPLARVPVTFEANLGQSPSDARYIARAEGYAAEVYASGLRFHTLSDGGPVKVAIRFDGASAEASLAPLAQLPGKRHYYRGNDPDGWVTDVPQYARLKGEQIYPGIDVIYRGNNQLAFDFMLAPGADPEQIVLRFDSQDSVRVGDDGRVRVATAAGDLFLHAPVIYQQRGERIEDVNGRFVQQFDGSIGFELDPYDTRYALVIDPTIAFATYLGDGAEESGSAIAIGADNTIYVTGYDLDYILPSYFPFIAKFTADGSQLVFETSFGGTASINPDFSNDIALEPNGGFWVVGTTTSFDFPVTQGAYDISLGPVVGGLRDGFFARFNALGQISYASYTGGDGLAPAFGVALGNDSLYITGDASSAFNTTANAFDRDCGVDGDDVCDGQFEEYVDAFLMRFDDVGSNAPTIAYSSFFGGQPTSCMLNPQTTIDIRTGEDHGLDIEVDAAGRAYVFGNTLSSEGFPIRNGYDATYDINFCVNADRFNEELFLAVFDTSLDGDASLLYSTFIGGAGDEEPGGMAIEADCATDCSVYVTGSTRSADVLNGQMPPNTPYGASLNGGNDVFAIKLDPYVSGAAGVEYFTFLGGSGFENPWGGIAIPRGCTQDCGAYISGTTGSADFPQVLELTSRHSSAEDLFITRLLPDASGLSYSTLFGGTGTDMPTDIAADDRGSVYVIGYTNSMDNPGTPADDEGFPTSVGTLQTVYGGGNTDSFLFRLCDGDPGPVANYCVSDVIPFENFHMAGIADLNSNGYAEVAVMVQGGSSHVHIRDGDTGELISDIDFGNDPITGMAVIDDISGNGMPEVALLGTRPDANVRVQIKDSDTGLTVNNVFYGNAYSAVDMTVMPDTDQNGADELVVLGTDATGGVRAQARDALTDAATSTTYFGDNQQPMDVLVIPDVSGNDEPEVLMNGLVTASNQGRAQMRDSQVPGLPGFIRNIYFGDTYAPVGLEVIQDISGDGVPDLAHLGRRDDTGAVRIQVKRSDTGVTVSNAFTGNTSIPITVVGIGDVNGNTASDVALLVQLTDGTARIFVRDGATGAFIRNTFVNSVSNPVAMALVPDMNGSGEAELAVLGDDGAGTKRVQIKDSITGAQINTIDFP